VRRLLWTVVFTGVTSIALFTGVSFAHEHSLTLPNERCQELAHGQLGELFAELGEDVPALEENFGTSPGGEVESPQHANVHQGAPGTEALGGWGPGGYRDGNAPVDINWDVGTRTGCEEPPA
jgi:hypothetical protein